MNFILELLSFFSFLKEVEEEEDIKDGGNEGGVNEKGGGQQNISQL